MKMKEFAVDPDRMEHGAWIDDIPEMQGLRLKVRGANNADWRRLQAKLIDATPRKQRPGGRLDPDAQDRIMSSCLLNACLLDWEGLEDDEGKPIPFSKDEAQKLLTDQAYRRFRDAVVWAATVVSDGEEAAIEDDAGNLLRLSAGTSDGGRKSKAG